MKNVLDTDVRYVKGIGPGNAKLLRKIGISTIGNIFYYGPFRTEDRRAPLTAAEILANVPSTENVFFAGTIINIRGRKTPRRRANIVEITVEDFKKTGMMKLVAFGNRVKYIVALLKPGMKIAVFGKAEISPEGLSMTNFDFEVLSESGKYENLSFYRLVGVYRLAKGISLKRFRRWVRNALDLYSGKVGEVIPPEILKSLKLPQRGWAFEKAHFPESYEEQARAYGRIKFEDFFIFECAVAYNHYNMRKKIKPRKYVLKKTILTPWKSTLPFEFTVGQKKAIRDIFADMLAPCPMNRLLQGEVGCGKTVVAAAAALLAKENNYQSVFLAPTVTLAYQHFETLRKIFDGTGVNLALLTGEMKKKDRDAELAGIATGRTDIVIGTHALLTEDVEFRNLALLIIDEQQRFGVHQKAALASKTFLPDILVLTATPIPRALALTLFGDLSRTEIREIPPGRKKIDTLHLSRREAYDMIRKEIEKGFQAFIIYPLIEEHDGADVFSAEASYKYLSKEIFPDFKLALLHGKMSSERKNRVMNSFASGRTDILVSTTVVEVGVDVPRATIMLIENAERYGLSTLHQLRGRIGRGGAESKCIVTTGAGDLEALKRVSFFLGCADGFELAEKDLLMRGAGQYFGVAQHGSMDVSFNYNKTIEAKFSEVSDITLLKQARRSAFEILKNDPALLKFPEIKKRILSKFGASFHLAEVT